MTENSIDRMQWRSVAPHRLPGFDYASPHHAYFVTACARDGDPFADPRLAQQIVDSLHWLHHERALLVYAYTLMPDHLHLLAGLQTSDRTLGQLLGAFKSFTTRQSWRLGYRGALWQPRFYDHIVDRAPDGRSIAGYILENPVRRGLIASGDEYPWSGRPDPL